MFKKLAVIIILSIACIQAVCQTINIQGKVLDKETCNPVPNASVFLSNTSIGTAADAKGVFTLHNAPNGKFDLVISSLGYETYFETIVTTKLTEPLVIKLAPKANQLADVVVGTYEKDGWSRWGKTFINDFIGMSSNAMSCFINNSKVIKFRYSKKRNLLEAFADEPLEIENKALGYIIHYKLEGFTHDFANNTISYFGFPLFEQMEGNFRKQKRWEENRKDVYYGSVTHFMRCLYVNKLQENGFEIRHMEKRENIEKKRVQALYKYWSEGNINFEDNLPRDSVKHYQKVLGEPSAYDVLYTQLLPGDSIAYGEDSVTAALAFDNYLHVTYKNKKAPGEYRPVTLGDETMLNPAGKEIPSSGNYMTSTILLLNKRPVYVSHNGAYYAPQDMLSAGYWGWSEKVANMLPFDYWP